METIDLYIDASFNATRNNGKCAAILIHDEKEYQWSKGLRNEEIDIIWNEPGSINSNEYEMATLIFFIGFLINKKIKNKTIIVYTDSLNMFEAYYNLCKTRNKKFNQMLANLISVINNIKPNNVELEIRWIPGHKNIYGNVKANYYTKHHFKQSNKTVELINTWQV
jgi:ribonuclease HI